MRRIISKVALLTLGEATRVGLRILAIGLMALMVFGSGDDIGVDAAGDGIQALWVWPATPGVPNWFQITDETMRDELVQRSAASGVDALYVSVYRYPENTAGRRMYEDSDMADLIGRAHDEGMEVWAAYGNPDWPDLGCAYTAFPLQRMVEVIAYNAANPSATFDGVVLDVEPPEPQTESDFQNLLTLYQCIRSTLAPEGLGLAVAIRFFWDTPVEFPAGGPVKPAYQHIIDMDLDKVVVMGYRDLAGTPCPADGIICLDQDEIAYADTLGKANLILVGIETQNCAPGCGPEKVTFFEEGQEVLNQEAHAVAEHFDANPSFGGFAIHHYGHSYLGELPGWPPFNGGFPIETNTPEGANIVVEPVDATTGTTPVTATFSVVSQPGNTSLTTSSVGPAPPSGFMLGDPPTYYDLTTTADFIPPIEVCIDYSGITFTGLEEDLRLLHFEDPDWVDHTLLPVDIANKMICASVTSLSPFAVFEPENQPPIADAGPDQMVECTSSTGASVMLNGSGSSDPDGDPLSFSWSAPGITFDDPTSPTATFPFGTTTVTLVVNDGTEDSAPDTVDITVQDTTPPTLSAQWVPLEVEEDEGEFRLEFSAADICDPAPQVTGVVETPALDGLEIKLKTKSKVKVEFNLNEGKVEIRGPDPEALLAQLQQFGGLLVDSGQLVKVELEEDDEGEQEFKFKGGKLKIEAPSATLKVTGEDASGNTATVQVSPQFAPEGGDEDDGD